MTMSIAPHLLNERGELVLGPRHHGLAVTDEEFEHAEGEDGYRYELINGVVHVSPAPDPYAQNIADALLLLLKNHRDASARPAFAEVIREPRIFVPESPKTTVPQPDLAAYEVYPRKPVKTYRNLQPVLVVEVVTPDSLDKDYFRNVPLYAAVPSILEYWIVDPSEEELRPTMAVHRRDAGRQNFERIDIRAGGVYEPPRWPGLRIELERIASE
jgi:Uma2 family endonuclease